MLIVRYPELCKQVLSPHSPQSPQIVIIDPLCNFQQEATIPLQKIGKRCYLSLHFVCL